MQKVRLQFSVALIALLAFGLTSAIAMADSVSADFESPTYTTGSPNGQDGWTSLGSAGMGCATYDHAVATNTFGIAGFGSQLLRMSNSVTSGCFGDNTFTKSLANEAGETTAQSSALSGGTRQNHFEAEFDVASVMGTEQVGQFVSISPDRGDGARMSYVGLSDQADGIHVLFVDYVDAAPFGTLASPANGCAAEDDFVQTDIATINHTAAHTIKLTIDFMDGPGNDVVNVYVDGVLEATGGTWEDYFRWCTESGGGVPNDAGADVSRTVDSLLFRTGGTAFPANAGKGYAFDNLSLSSSMQASCENPSAPQTEVFSSAGSHSFNVPENYCSISVALWGAGGGGGGSGNTSPNGATGGSSSFNGSVVAGGGLGGVPNGGGAGGTASGGDTNTSGTGGATPNNTVGGVGGTAPSGGAGGAGGVASHPAGYDGIQAGGGGGGVAGARGALTGGGAGSGAYAVKTFGEGVLTGGSSVSVVVGAGGIGGVRLNNTSFRGGTGGDGKVVVTYTLAQ